ncbi:DUF4920 domain-containing protein [Flavobacteriaceae bacterium R38]|nr:DUF4920 domain-containing protein [Flavobacteriaceae bacterium R38]
MKPLFVLVTAICLLSCNNKTNKTIEEHPSDNIAENSFGLKIDDKKALNTNDAFENYQTISLNDSLTMKFTGVVKDVCKAKGCWMKLDLENGEEVMVKFKDYGFFVPTDIEGETVVVNGKAFVNEMSVEEQKHYAEDAGENPDEIAKIESAKKTYSFLADGVLIMK